MKIKEMIKLLVDNGDNYDTQVKSVSGNEWAIEVSFDNGDMFELVGSNGSNGEEPDDLWLELQRIRLAAKEIREAAHKALKEKIYYLLEGPSKKLDMLSERSSKVNGYMRLYEVLRVNKMAFETYCNAFKNPFTTVGYQRAMDMIQAQEEYDQEEFEAKASKVEDISYE